ncbi:MAG: TonB-dependent receptor [Burkholderiales bacterium]|nr:TonB-dependent receptor [Burkholderiales bacterium]MDE1926588.1 TonB-dependent receptor [Burkholderiales bacterium]MDE2501389.1 TonB-dependent receptor [Burkholderiales bacterium]
MSNPYRNTVLHLSLVAAFGLASAVARADDAPAVQTVNVVGNTLPASSAIAPTHTSLDAIQPQSIIGQQFISENSAAGANYSDIVNIAPGVFSVDPNGPGLMESQSLTIRGFQDGQYNVTFDGIPWGDSNDFTHHSTVYFMPQDMGNIVVDRGPGQAGTVGDATFGGTIAIGSKPVPQQAGGSVYGSAGSWRTGLLGAEYDGSIGDGADAAHYLIDAKGLRSDGFLTHSPQQRQNIFFKIDKPLAAGLDLSLVLMRNHTLQHVPYGATPTQQQQYGYNIGLVNDPTSQMNSAYNYDELNSDFGYLGLKSARGAWHVDNKLYTYGYFHQGYNGANPGSLTGSDGGTQVGATLYPNDVPGQRMHMYYRSVGDIARASYDIGSDALQFGLWFDHQTNSRFQQEIDWTQNMAPNELPNGAGGSVDRDQNNTLTTIQPYVQYAWKPSAQWTVTPGVKYVSFKRTMNAAVNQKTLLPFSGGHTWTKALPSIDAHYAVDPHLSLYAQYAKGFLAPNMNVFYKTTPNFDTVKPTQTNNYQLGANWSSQSLSLGADVYRIDSTNLSSATACPAGITGACYATSAGVKFDGAEIEATYVLGAGLSLYGNLGLNNWTTNDGSVLQNSPKRTSALGLIYQDMGWYASLMAKNIGSRYSNVDSNGNNLTLGAYTVANLDMSYTLPRTLVGAHAVKIGLKVDNLFGRRGDFASTNSDINGNPLFFVVPTRSYQANFSVGF